jgi:hypothetical protein
MPTQNLRVGFSATATSVGERGNDISLTSFSRHSLVIPSRPDRARADLCEEPAAQLAGKLPAANCGRSAAADEAK